ncbi:MAG: alkaline phosphatase family protein [Candidatus Acidiferrales bacterium]
MTFQNFVSILVMVLALQASTPPVPVTGTPDDQETTTPIKHLVVIFQENESFDHYFGTYPHAANPKGEPAFDARPGTPAVNGLSAELLTANPNGSANLPFRLDRSQNYTCDMNHGYTAEQQAFDTGLMDMFPRFAAFACSSLAFPTLATYGTRIVMGYFDGNTITALWNYAQHFAMSDAFHGTNFGPSTLGAINLVSGMTGKIDKAHTAQGAGGGLAHDVVDDSLVGDPGPYYDDCTYPDRVALLGKNIGDLLTEKRHISWGWFAGGFTPSVPYSPATSTSPEKHAKCETATIRIDGKPIVAYAPHHEPFQYYKSTANPHHRPPAFDGEIGHDGPANHQYDLTDFWRAANSDDMPAVSFLKAPAAQDGHPGNSSPLDEQAFLVATINRLQLLPAWKDTLVIIAWDDSDGWYDHVAGPIVNPSRSPADALTGKDQCGTGADSLAGIQARCGYGPRLPLLLISGYAKENFVDSTVTDQSSITRFIEYNWELEPIGHGSFDTIAGPLTNMLDFNHFRSTPLLLDPSTGELQTRH